MGWVIAKRRTTAGVLGALVVSVATFWKTIIYFLVEICGHMAYTRHTIDAGNWKGFLGITIAPNAVWIVVPAIAIVALLRQLHQRVAAA